MNALANPPTHLMAMTLFALTVSIVFGFLSKPTAQERLRYIVLAFAAFMVVAIGLGWLMYPFSQ